MISTPSAGELKHFVKLIKRVDYPLGNDDCQQVDTLIWKGWAKIEPTGSYYWGVVQVENKATHRIWIRAVAGKSDPLSITHGVLLKIKDRFYRPTRVTDANGEGKFTVIEAQELGVVNAENSNPLYEESTE